MSWGLRSVGEPQFATPNNLIMVNDDGREVSFCEHCDVVVIFDPSDMRPGWFHYNTGSRVCGATKL